MVKGFMVSKKLSLISSIFLTTTCLLSIPDLEASGDLITDNQALCRVRKIGRSKFLAAKAKKRQKAIVFLIKATSKPLNCVMEGCKMEFQ